METTASVIDFNKYINERTTHFTGRQWVFQRIDAWLADSARPRFFLLVANPGSGKTALIARLCQFSDGTVVPLDGLLHLTPHFISASHFCSARYSLWIDPLTFTRSLALQLSRYPDYARALLRIAEHDVNIHVQQLIHNLETGGVVQGVVIQNLTIANLNPQESFNRIILEPLETMYHQGFSTPMTIVIDGLDEALAHAGQPTIVDLLSRLHELPQQVRFLLTSRPEERVENKFQDAEEVLLSATEYDQRNQEDIYQYVQVRLRNDQELANMAAQVDSKHLAELMKLVPRKAEGNFLYVRFLLDAMAKGVRPLMNLEGLPEGLDRLYFDSLERVVTLGKQDWRTGYASLIGILLVAQEPLTFAQLQAFTGQSESVIWSYVNDFWQFIGGEEPEGNQEKKYRLYHQTFIDFLGRQWITVIQQKRQRQHANAFYLSAEEWHMRVARVCEQGNLSNIWQNVTLNPVEQGRREYARKYYITHLYLAQARQRLFEVLNTVQYGKAKLRNDPSTHSYALDLDLGRQATMWEGWTIDKGIALLPALWQYTLLRCSLTSRANQYPDEAFRLLVLLGRKQEALELAELLTEPIKKVRVLLCIAEQLREQASHESEWLEILMSERDVVCTIPDSLEQAKALRDLSITFAKARQWTQAERLIDSIPDSLEQAKALRDLSITLAQAGQWAQAERLIGTISRGSQRAEALSALSTTLAQAGQWAQAECLIDSIPDSLEQAKALRDLSIALAQARQWAQAERLIDSIDDNYRRNEALSFLGTALTQAGQDKHAAQVWARAERLINTIPDSLEQAKALRDLSIAFAKAMQWTQAKRLLSAIKDSIIKAEALRDLSIAFVLAGQWMQAKRLLSTIKDSLEQVLILGKLSIALAQMGQWIEAKRLLSTIKDSYMQAAMLVELGIFLTQTGHGEHASQVWEQSERLISTITERSWRTEVLSALGIASAQAGQWTRAEHLIGSIEDRDWKARVLSALGIALAQAGQDKHAAQVWAQTERLFSIIQGSLEQVQALRDLGITLAQAGQDKHAVQVWAQAERVIDSIPDSLEQVQALKDLGTALAQAGQDKHAVQVWAQAERVIGSIQDDYWKARALSALGIALAQAGQDKHAAQVWAQAERLIGSIQKSYQRAETLSALSIALAQAGHWTKAERVISTIMYNDWQAVALSALGIALAQAGQNKQALQVWARVEGVISPITDNLPQTWAFGDLGIIFAQTGQWAQAERIIDNIKDSYSRAKALSVLGTTLAQAGQGEQALQVWARVELVSSTITNSFEQAEVLRDLATRMASADELKQLLQVTQRAWHQVETREEVLNLFSIVSIFISRKPVIGIAFIDAFNWVDTFLGGGD